jgi:hypothetical protein
MLLVVVSIRVFRLGYMCYPLTIRTSDELILDHSINSPRLNSYGELQKVERTAEAVGDVHWV